MKLVYPVVLSKDGNFYMASIPDCEIDTQGDNIVDAIEMARDAIAMWTLCQLDANKELPTASSLKSITVEDGDTITLVDVDIEAYRRKHEKRTVRKNCTIPHWLNEVAEREHINFSKVLQEGLMSQLNI